jgi:hypothetical protein
MHVPTYADLRAMGVVEGLSGRLVEMGDSPPSRCGRDIARMILVGRYQSIADTLVQLFIYLPFCCDRLIATRSDREMRRKGE